MCLDTTLSTSQVLTQLMFTTILRYRYYHYQHLLYTGEGTKTQNSYITCFSSQSWLVAELGFKLKHLAAGTMLFTLRLPAFHVAPCVYGALHAASV